MATLVSRNIGAIGYVELSYAIENSLPVGIVKNKEGKYLAPTLESVTAAAAGSLGKIPNDLRYTLTDAPGEDSYPIAGTTWAVLYVNQTKQSIGKDLVAFLRWITHEGQAYTTELKYAPLPPELVKKVDNRLETVEVK